MKAQLPAKHALFVLALAAFGVSALPAYANVTLLDKDDWKVGFYGFAETDAIVDSTRSLTEVVGNKPIDRPSTLNGDVGRSQFSIRNSRFGFDIRAPKAGDWNSKGILEFDFLGADNTAEAALFNNATLRPRHAYFAADSSGWQFLAGQTWTLFGWQPGYFISSLSVSPISGVLYQRTAQFTLIKTLEFSDVNKLAAGVSVVRPAQRDAQLPGLDAGVRWAWSGRKAGYVGLTGAEAKAQPLSLALTGRLNEFKYNGAGDTVSSTSMLGSAVALDTMIPILGSSEDNVGNTMSFSGEFSMGQGYAEAFPGWTGNLKSLTAGSFAAPTFANTNINVDAGQLGNDPNNGITLVHLQSFNMQLQYHFPTEWMTFVTAGYGQLYSNNVDTLIPTAGSTYNRAETYFFNVAHNFTKQIRLAAEYDVFRTAYSDGVIGHDNRVQVSTFFYF